MKNTLSIVLICFIALNESPAQEVDSVENVIKRSIEKSFVKGVDRKKCQDFKSALFSIAITFTADANVEKVIFSESQDCFSQSKNTITKFLQEKIDNLGNRKSILSNKYILAPIMILPDERTDSSSVKIPDNWEQHFKGIGAESLNGKSLQYIIPVGIYLLPRIEN